MPLDLLPPNAMPIPRCASTYLETKNLSIFADRSLRTLKGDIDPELQAALAGVDVVLALAVTMSADPICQFLGRIARLSHSCSSAK